MNLNHRDPRPIYQQLKDDLRSRILTGAIIPGEQLPSVRELASQLAINPNTIQRAYRDLEAEGYIYTLPGKGSFAGSVQDVDDSRLQRLWRSFDATVAELKYLGITEPELTLRIQGGHHP